jgi:hypothetical protein
MKKIAVTLLTSLIFLTAFGQTKVCLIGELHEENEIINPDTLINILKKIKPDVILIELDSQFFTSNFDFNLDLVLDPDSMSGNQNVASYRC